MLDIMIPIPWALLSCVGAALFAACALWFLLRSRFMTLEQDLLSAHQMAQDKHEKLLVAEERLRTLQALEAESKILKQDCAAQQGEITRLELTLKQERDRAEEKVALLDKAQQDFQNAFKALSAEALSKNNQNFLDLAKATLGRFQESAKSDLKSTEKAFSDLVTPVKEALGTVNKRMEEVEKNRIGAYEGLKEQVGNLLSTQKDLRSETANLVKALRAPTVRGRWGEMQLKRVVEMSGMNAHCDFTEQANLQGDNGPLRPDMIVHLPNKKHIIIDAKTPLAAYLEALEAQSDDLRRAHLKDHARHVRGHINALSSRNYWDHLAKSGTTPEFVVLFLPGEAIFTAALEQDPSLIEDGVQKNVIIATPATLIALLHAVAFGWRQESLAENAREISELGRELYKRCSDMGGHLAKLGRDLTSAVGSYNKTIGSMERRVLPSARKFKELQASTREDIPALVAMDHTPRPLEAEELLPETEVAS